MVWKGVIIVEVVISDEADTHTKYESTLHGLIMRSLNRELVEMV